MLHHPFLGAGYFVRGLKLLAEPGLRRFVVLPLAVNVVMFSLLIWFGAHETGRLMHWLMPELPRWLEFIQWLLWLIYAVVAGVLVFFTFTLLANLIGAPFNSLLAEAVERHATGLAPPGAERVTEMIKAIPAILWDEIKKLGYYLAWALPLLVLFLIPGVNLAAPFIWALFGAWMFAVQYSDYAMGNHGLKGKEMRARLRDHRLLSLGFGGTTLLATLVPVLNFVVMPAAVAGATLMWVERINREGA